MVFEPKKFTDVFSDMRERTSVITDFEVGSVVRTLYESFSYEIALLYEKMQLVYLSAYVDTAEGYQLDKVVAVLGVKRGLPDFAEGEVTYLRDVGNQDITIPLGTLVATVDTPESPKLVYQTSEEVVFPKDQTAIAIKIQAVNRGEEQVTPAETLVVLPRPVAGIKSVSNLEATRFTGKRRETDEQLRERAKNALISSGKATVLSIENALLSLPGVKDVKVRENFRYARGEAVFTRGSAMGKVVIPKGTGLVVTVPAVPQPLVQPFKTTERMVLGEFSSTVSVPLQSLTEGKAGELRATEGMTWQIDDPMLQAGLTVSNLVPLLLSEFGVIDVFVDCDKFEDPAVQKQLQAEIDRVRAAGIFVLLKSAIAIQLDGAFQIETSPDLNLTPEERSKLERSVRDEIIKVIQAKQMGQPLLFAQIIKNVLSLNGVNNLEEFELNATKIRQDGVTQHDRFDPSNKRIEVDEFEKINARYLCVASEIKSLPIQIQFKAAGLDILTRTTILTALGDYFGGLKVKDPVAKSAIANRINATPGITVTPGTLKLTPQSWCQSAPPVTGDLDTITPTFVEKAVLGDVFAYNADLQIVGALKLTLPATLTDPEKLAVRDRVRTEINRYLSSLKPEEDVVFAEVIQIAAAINPVIQVDLTSNDFRVFRDGTATVGRVSIPKIEVQAFEKTQLQNFCITSGIEPVLVEVTALELGLVVTSPPPPGFNQSETVTALQNAARTTVNNFLANATAGQSIVYATLKNSLDNLVPAANYTLKQLSLSATSACDNRSQTTTIDTAIDLHLRSVEIPTLQPITPADVTVTIKTVVLPPPPPPPAP